MYVPGNNVPNPPEVSWWWGIQVSISSASAYIATGRKTELNNEVRLTTSKYACAVAGILKGRVQSLNHLCAARCCAPNGPKWCSLL